MWTRFVTQNRVHWTDLLNLTVELTLPLKRGSSLTIWVTVSFWNGLIFYITSAAKFIINTVRMLHVKTYTNWSESQNTLVACVCYKGAIKKCFVSALYHSKPSVALIAAIREELYLVICRLADSLQACFTTMCPSLVGYWWPSGGQ